MDAPQELYRAVVHFFASVKYDADYTHDPSWTTGTFTREDARPVIEALVYFKSAGNVVLLTDEEREALLHASRRREISHVSALASAREKLQIADGNNSE